MAKVNMTKFQKYMEQAIKELESPAEMRAIGEEVAKRIVTRTALGKGVAETGGPPVSLSPLSKSYKQQRAGKIAFATGKNGKVFAYDPGRPPDLSDLTSPGKSNLTFTRQMLNAVKVVAAKVGSVTIGVANSSRTQSVRNKFGNFRRKSLLTNRDVAGLVSDKRPWLDMSGPEMNGFQRLIRERLDAILKRLRRS